MMRNYILIFGLLFSCSPEVEQVKRLNASTAIVDDAASQVQVPELTLSSSALQLIANIEGKLSPLTSGSELYLTEVPMDGDMGCGSIDQSVVAGYIDGLKKELDGKGEEDNAVISTGTEAVIKHIQGIEDSRVRGCVFKASTRGLVQTASRSSEGAVPIAFQVVSTLMSVEDDIIPADRARESKLSLDAVFTEFKDLGYAQEEFNEFIGMYGSTRLAYGQEVSENSKLLVLSLHQTDPKYVDLAVKIVANHADPEIFPEFLEGASEGASISLTNNSQVTDPIGEFNKISSQFVEQLSAAIPAEKTVLLEKLSTVQEGVESTQKKLMQQVLEMSSPELSFIESQKSISSNPNPTLKLTMSSGDFKEGQSLKVYGVQKLEKNSKLCNGTPVYEYEITKDTSVLEFELDPGLRREGEMYLAALLIDSEIGRKCSVNPLEYTFDRTGPPKVELVEPLPEVIGVATEVAVICSEKESTVHFVSEYILPIEPLLCAEAESVVTAKIELDVEKLKTATGDAGVRKSVSIELVAHDNILDEVKNKGSRNYLSAKIDYLGPKVKKFALADDQHGNTMAKSAMYQLQLDEPVSDINQIKESLQLVPGVSGYEVALMDSGLPEVLTPAVEGTEETDMEVAPIEEPAFPFYSVKVLLEDYTGLEPKVVTPLLGSGLQDKFGNISELLEPIKGAQLSVRQAPALELEPNDEYKLPGIAGKDVFWSKERRPRLKLTAKNASLMEGDLITLHAVSDPLPSFCIFNEKPIASYRVGPGETISEKILQTKEFSKHTQDKDLFFWVKLTPKDGSRGICNPSLVSYRFDQKPPSNAVVLNGLDNFKQGSPLNLKCPNYAAEFDTRYVISGAELKAPVNAHCRKGETSISPKLVWKDVLSSENQTLKITGTDRPGNVTENTFTIKVDLIAPAVVSLVSQDSKVVTGDFHTFSLIFSEAMDVDSVKEGIIQKAGEMDADIKIEGEGSAFTIIATTEVDEIGKIIPLVLTTVMDEHGNRIASPFTTAEDQVITKRSPPEISFQVLSPIRDAAVATLGNITELTFKVDSSVEYTDFETLRLIQKNLANDSETILQEYAPTPGSKSFVINHTLTADMNGSYRVEIVYEELEDTKIHSSTNSYAYDLDTVPPVVEEVLFSGQPLQLKGPFSYEVRFSKAMVKESIGLALENGAVSGVPIASKIATGEGADYALQFNVVETAAGSLIPKFTDKALDLYGNKLAEYTFVEDKHSEKRAIPVLVLEHSLPAVPSKEPSIEIAVKTASGAHFRSGDLIQLKGKLHSSSDPEVVVAEHTVAEDSSEERILLSGAVPDALEGTGSYQVSVVLADATPQTVLSDAFLYIFDKTPPKGGLDITAPRMDHNKIRSTLKLDCDTDYLSIEMLASTSIEDFAELKSHVDNHEACLKSGAIIGREFMWKDGLSGLHTLRFQLADAAGNTSILSKSINVDSISPQVKSLNFTGDSPVRSDSDATFELVMSEPVSAASSVIVPISGAGAKISSISKSPTTGMTDRFTLQLHGISGMGRLEFKLSHGSGHFKDATGNFLKADYIVPSHINFEPSLSTEISDHLTTVKSQLSTAAKGVINTSPEGQVIQELPCPAGGAIMIRSENGNQVVNCGSEGNSKKVAIEREVLGEKGSKVALEVTIQDAAGGYETVIIPDFQVDLGGIDEVDVKSPLEEEERIIAVDGFGDRTCALTSKDRLFCGSQDKAKGESLVFGEEVLSIPHDSFGPLKQLVLVEESVGEPGYVVFDTLGKPFGNSKAGYLEVEYPMSIPFGMKYAAASTAEVDLGIPTKSLFIQLAGLSMGSSDSPGAARASAAELIVRLEYKPLKVKVLGGEGVCALMLGPSSFDPFASRNPLKSFLVCNGQAAGLPPLVLKAEGRVEDFAVISEDKKSLCYLFRDVTTTEKILRCGRYQQDAGDSTNPIGYTDFSVMGAGISLESVTHLASVETEGKLVAYLDDGTAAKMHIEFNGIDFTHIEKIDPVRVFDPILGKDDGGIAASVAEAFEVIEKEVHLDRGEWKFVDAGRPRDEEMDGVDYLTEVWNKTSGEKRFCTPDGSCSQVLDPSEFSPKADDETDDLRDLISIFPEAVKEHIMGPRFDNLSWVSVDQMSMCSWVGKEELICGRVDMEKKIVEIITYAIKDSSHDRIIRGVTGDKDRMCFVYGISDSGSGTPICCDGLPESGNCAEYITAPYEEGGISLIGSDLYMSSSFGVLVRIPVGK